MFIVIAQVKFSTLKSGFHGVALYNVNIPIERNPIHVPYHVRSCVIIAIHVQQVFSGGQFGPCLAGGINPSIFFMPNHVYPVISGQILGHQIHVISR